MAKVIVDSDKSWPPWPLFYHQNKTCGDCQLVSAVNALHFFKRRRIVDDQKYEKLIEIAGCRHGPATRMPEVHDELGLGIKAVHHSLQHALDLRCLKRVETLPLEVNLWHPRYGYHSVLVVGHSPITGSIRVTNFEFETTTHGWIFIERFRPWVEGHSLTKAVTYKLVK